MKKLLGNISAALIIAFGFTGAAQAIPVTINMTGDNILEAGFCSDMSCVSGTLFTLVNGADWQLSDTVDLDLDPGTYWFAWHVENLGDGSAGNPAGLLAEILWTTGANYSSWEWQIFNPETGAFVANATEYGSNGGANIWTTVNSGPVAGISTDANWIYTANNGTGGDAETFIRTSITVVPAPTTLSLLGMSLLGFGLLRLRRSA